MGGKERKTEDDVRKGRKKEKKERKERKKERRRGYGKSKAGKDGSNDLPVFAFDVLVREDCDLPFGTELHRAAIHGGEGGKRGSDLSFFELEGGGEGEKKGDGAEKEGRSRKGKATHLEK